MKKTTTVLLVGVAVLVSAHASPFISQIRAETMSNDNFIIQGSFNALSGKSSGPKYKVNATVGETGPGLYTGKNYKVKAGFEYIYPSKANFSFNVSQTIIDFGTLSATNPVTRTTNLTVINPSGGYTVLAYEDHPLLTTNGATINDTTCDNGACSDTLPALWTNTLTYGFGYRCDNLQGNDCEPGFALENYYKQFADLAKKENPQAIMSGKATNPQSQSKITYKVNISGTQQPGTYTNTITYIATPSF